MKTSELKEVLAGRVLWTELTTRYAEDQRRLLSRLDGCATSGDLPLHFDVDPTQITRCSLLSLCDAVERGLLTNGEVFFLSTAIVLSGFRYVDEQVEDAALELSTFVEDAELPGHVAGVRASLQ